MYAVSATISLLIRWIVLSILLIATPACAQNTVFDQTFYQARSGSLTIPNVRKGDYVRVEVWYSSPYNRAGHNCETVAKIAGRTIRCALNGPYNKTEEFFAGSSTIELTYNHTCDFPLGRTSAGRIRVLTGRPNLSLGRIYFENRQVVCEYRVGDVPWTPNGNYVGVGFYFARGPRAEDIIDRQRPFGYVAGLRNGLNERNLTDVVRLPLQDIGLAPYGGTHIVAVIDPDGRVGETDGGDNAAGIEWAFIEQVPHIMDDQGWRLGSRFQRKWFNGRAARATSPSNPTRDIERAEAGELGWEPSVLTMAWVLNPYNDSDGRAQKALNQLLKDFYTPSAQRECAELVRSEIKRRGDPINKRVPFGSVHLQGSARHKQHVTRASVSYFRIDGVSVDASQAALGGFTFYLIPCGTAQRDNKGKLTGEITSVGIYVVDIFEFEDKSSYWGEYLGDWRISPSGVLQVPTFAAGFDSLWNSDYRNYRAITGRGRDFVTMSDVGLYNLQAPIPFKY